MKNNLKGYRKGAGLTLDELSERARVSKSFLCDIEQELSNLTLERAYRVANVLGVSVYAIWPDQTKVEEEIITIRRVVKK